MGEPNAYMPPGMLLGRDDRIYLRILACESGHSWHHPPHQMTIPSNTRRIR